jgi:hypothetical protein
MAAAAAYVDNLREIEVLEDHHPDEDAIAEVADYRGNLEVIAGLDKPDEDEINAAANYRADLSAIAEMDGPSEDEIEAAAKHLATFKEIEEAEPA